MTILTPLESYLTVCIALYHGALDPIKMLQVAKVQNISIKIVGQAIWLKFKDSHNKAQVY